MTAVVLTIAGSDSGAGAGIQADLKTFAAFGVYGTCAVTAVTAQNTRGVRAVHVVPPDMVAAQVEAVLEDFDVRAVKIGMVPDAGHVAAIADCLAGRRIPIVLDPVMIASSGRRLMGLGTVDALRERLFPLATCLTPNLPEAAALTGGSLAVGEAEMAAQGQALRALGAGAVLVKGGHAGLDQAIDILVSDRGAARFAAPWIESRNLHGTGCTLSSAIAAGLAGGLVLETAVAQAKTYLTGAIAAGARHGIGQGAGPLEHGPAQAVR